MAAGALASAAFVRRQARATDAAPTSRQVTAVTLIDGIAGNEGELRQHLLSLAAPTRAEPGCVTYDLYQSSDQPHEFMRFEVWTNLDALEAHKATPHIQASFEKRQREGWTTRILTWNRVPE